MTDSTRTPTTEPVATFTLRPASDYHRQHYGLLFESAETVDVTGRAAHNPHHPHRVMVWESPDCTGGFGTHLLTAEAVVIALHPGEQSTRLGAVQEGDLVGMVYPDGSTDFGVVTGGVLRDPKLVLVTADEDDEEEQFFDLDGIAAELTNLGVRAVVADTSGGTATLYAGEPVWDPTDEVDRAPFSAGPGFFTTLPDGTRVAQAYRDEFGFGDNRELVGEICREFDAPYEVSEVAVAGMIAALVRGEVPEGARAV